MADSYSLSYSIIITILLFLLIRSSTPLEFNFPSLSQSNPSLLTEGNATFTDSNQLQLTANETDHIGRVRYSDMLHLWDNSSGKLIEADFTTAFSFIIYSTDRAPGDGIAFFLAQPPFLMPSNTDGSAIGLVRSQERGKSAYPFVAVEFDTFGNNFDPPDRGAHVGIDVSSLISNETVSWACDVRSMNVYNATVSYVARTRNLSVAFNGFIDKVQIQQSLSYTIRLADYLPEFVNFGFSSANGLFTSWHILLSWSFNSTSLEIEATSPTPNNNNNTNATTSTTSSNPGGKSKLAVWLGIGGALILISATLLVIFLVFIRKKKRRAGTESRDRFLSSDVTMDDEFEKGSGARRFSYEELVSATKNFAREEKLGEGGFGEVYKGFLMSSDSWVAIKKVSKWSNQGIKEYASEVKIISRLRHKNLVQLVGWCHEKGDLLLVYEFMPNGSLDSHLWGTGGVNYSLTWSVRYNVARGLGSALQYLHEECEKCVLHRDVKPSNVMLDSDFNAKLGDFGLARLVEHGKGAQTTKLAGTLGYLAPECVFTAKASKESDIYSFGIVVLEIVSGRKMAGFSCDEDDKSLVDWIWELHNTNRILEAADPKLRGVFDEQQMVRLILVGLWCSHPELGVRPSIKQASHVLDFQAPLPVLPTYYGLPSMKFGYGTSSASGTKSFSSTDVSQAN